MGVSSLNLARAHRTLASPCSHLLVLPKLKDLGTHSSFTLDSIPRLQVKLVHCDVCNAVVRDGKIPEDWSRSWMVVNVYKGKGDALTWGSYSYSLRGDVLRKVLLLLYNDFTFLTHFSSKKRQSLSVCLSVGEPIFLANHETHRTNIFSVSPSIHMPETVQIWFISNNALWLK